MAREAALLGVEDYEDPSITPFTGLADAMRKLSQALDDQPFQQAFAIYREEPLLDCLCTQGAIEAVLKRWELAPLELVTLVLAGHCMKVNGVPHFVPYGLPAEAPGLPLPLLLELVLKVARSPTQVVLVLDFCFSGWVVERLREMRTSGAEVEAVSRISAIASAPANRTSSPSSSFLNAFTGTLAAAPQTDSGVLLVPGLIAGVQGRVHSHPEIGMTFIQGDAHADLVFAANPASLATRLPPAPPPVPGTVAAPAGTSSPPFEESVASWKGLDASFSGFGGLKAFWLAALTLVPAAIGSQFERLGLTLGPVTGVYLAYHALGLFLWNRVRHARARRFELPPPTKGLLAANSVHSGAGIAVGLLLATTLAATVPAFQRGGGRALNLPSLAKQALGVRRGLDPNSGYASELLTSRGAFCQISSVLHECNTATKAECEEATRKTYGPGGFLHLHQCVPRPETVYCFQFEYPGTNSNNCFPSSKTCETERNLFRPALLEWKSETCAPLALGKASQSKGYRRLTPTERQRLRDIVDLYPPGRVLIQPLKEEPGVVGLASDFSAVLADAGWATQSEATQMTEDEGVVVLGGTRDGDDECAMPKDSAAHRLAYAITSAGLGAWRCEALVGDGRPVLLIGRAPEGVAVGEFVSRADGGTLPSPTPRAAQPQSSGAEPAEAGPKPEPNRLKEARVVVVTGRSGEISIAGDLTEAQVNAALKTAEAELVNCYDSARRAAPLLTGRIDWRIVVSANGAVASAKALKSDVTPTLTDCVAGVIRRIAFPRHPGANVALIKMPFLFELPSKALPAVKNPGCEPAELTFLRPEWDGPAKSVLCAGWELAADARHTNGSAGVRLPFVLTGPGGVMRRCEALCIPGSQSQPDPPPECASVVEFLELRCDADRVFERVRPKP